MIIKFIDLNKIKMSKTFLKKLKFSPYTLKDIKHRVSLNKYKNNDIIFILNCGDGYDHADEETWSECETLKNYYKEYKLKKFLEFKL